jgi:hypothetical protein
MLAVIGDVPVSALCETAHIHDLTDTPRSISEIKQHLAGDWLSGDVVIVSLDQLLVDYDAPEHVKWDLPLTQRRLVNDLLHLARDYGACVIARGFADLSALQYADFVVEAHSDLADEVISVRNRFGG